MTNTRHPATDDNKKSTSDASESLSSAVELSESLTPEMTPEEALQYLQFAGHSPVLSTPETSDDKKSRFPGNKLFGQIFNPELTPEQARALQEAFDQETRPPQEKGDLRHRPEDVNTAKACNKIEGNKAAYQCYLDKQDQRLVDRVAYCVLTPTKKGITKKGNRKRKRSLPGFRRWPIKNLLLKLIAWTRSPQFEVANSMVFETKHTKSDTGYLCALVLVAFIILCEKNTFSHGIPLGHLAKKLFPHAKNATAATLQPIFARLEQLNLLENVVKSQDYISERGAVVSCPGYYKAGPAFFKNFVKLELNLEFFGWSDNSFFRKLNVQLQNLASEGLEKLFKGGRISEDARDSLPLSYLERADKWVSYFREVSRRRKSTQFNPLALIKRHKLAAQLKKAGRAGASFDSFRVTIDALAQSAFRRTDRQRAVETLFNLILGAIGISSLSKATYAAFCADP